MIGRILIAPVLMLSACTGPHGGPNDPIASADSPFQRELAVDLASESEAFARKNGLQFQNDSDRDVLILKLRKGDLTIEASNRKDPRRLKVTATGPVTRESIELAGRFIEALDTIH